MHQADNARRAKHIYLKDFRPFFRARVHHRSDRANSRIVDQDVQATGEPSAHLSGRLRHVRFVGDIARNEVAHTCEPTLLKVKADDVGSGVSKTGRDVEANSGTGPRDDRAKTLKLGVYFDHFGPVG